MIKIWFKIGIFVGDHSNFSLQLPKAVRSITKCWVHDAAFPSCRSAYKYLIDSRFYLKMKNIPFKVIEKQKSLWIIWKFC